VTQWISYHDDGLAEWAKNSRRAYQPDRANVPPELRVAVIVLQDAQPKATARIGFLDVGGATLEDVTAWSVWQDPGASSRRPDVEEEQTQGNGGKAYMYRLFRGPAYILGIRDGRRNCKGFEGPPGTLERGIPGFIPNADLGRESAVSSVEAEVDRVLGSYGLSFTKLPEAVRLAIAVRGAFTFVEGVDPIDLWQGRIPSDELIQKFLRHDQTVLALEQMKIYALHNGRALNDGNPLVPEPIQPFSGVDGPFKYDIPDSLPDEDGVQQSTTASGTMPGGLVTLFTSKENMPNAWRRLRPRWKVSYRTRTQMIGSKPVSDLLPPAPGYQHVYGVVEIDALEAYVTQGRIRPREGPLLNAIDSFVAGKIRDIAKMISERTRQELDEQALNEVQKENERLDRWKNRFLESAIGQDAGGGGEDSSIGRKTRQGHPTNWGDIAEVIELEGMGKPFRIGRGVSLHLSTILKPVVRDHFGRPISGALLEWLSSDRKILDFPDSRSDEATALRAGAVQVRVRIPKTDVVSQPALFEVWNVDHVLLTPREIEIPVGVRKQITAEVTDDRAERATDVLLSWRHEADDQLVIRIRPTGWITGNRVGRTVVLAGAGDPTSGGVWSRIGVDVRVIPNPDLKGPGQGFPRLLITGRDLDPETGQVREGDPEQPSLWQEVPDYLNNVWWLNLEAPDARFAFSQREEDPHVWRQFHATALTQTVLQVHMQSDFTKRESQERPESWAVHKAALDRLQIQLVGAMWQTLGQYVLTGEGID